MAKNNNLGEFLSDIADAIREKKGTADPINAQSFSDEIRSIQAGGSGWTGHADAEGLKAIGWTDDDIAYYQEHGVNWNEEDDESHKVTDDNKALYGVVTADNISTYADRIVYLPKINTSKITEMQTKFKNCYSLVAIPMLDTSKVTNMTQLFYNCFALTSVPPLDTQNVLYMDNMFYTCRSLRSIPQFNTKSVTNMASMCYGCFSLEDFPLLDMKKVTNINNMFYQCYSLRSIPRLDTSLVTNMSYMFAYCTGLTTIPELNVQNVTSIGSMFNGCYSIVTANLKNVRAAYQLNYCALLSKESLLYIINNEASTSAITIKLKAYAYTRLANDADVVAALANHPNISISQ